MYRVMSKNSFEYVLLHIMKIKNIRSSLIVFFILAIASFAFFSMAQEQSQTSHNIFLDNDQDGLSDEEERAMGTDPRNADSDGDSYSDGAEVRSGYNPLKPSPGDKLIPDANAPVSENADPNKPNMTREMSQKISALVSTSDPENQEITIDQIKNLVSESIEPSFAVDTEAFPEVKKEDIKIKKSPSLKGLSEEEIAEIRKNEFADYIAGTTYIISSNSPEPITSALDISAISSSITGTITSAVSSRNPEQLKKLEDSEHRILEQMKDIAVPEDLVDFHIKTIRAVRYSQELNKLLVPNANDPLMDITNLAKISGFNTYLLEFSEEMTEKFDSYGLTYDDSFQEKLTSYGVDLPMDEIIQKSSE